MMDTRSNSSSVEDAQSETCIYCKLEVKDGDPSIECNKGSGWAHLNCSKLPEAALSIIVEPLTATKISESLTSLQESIEEMKDKSKFRLVPSGSKISQNKHSDSNCHEREFRVSGLDEYKSEPNESIISSKIIEYETEKNRGSVRLFGRSKARYNQYSTAGQKNYGT